MAMPRLQVSQRLREMMRYDKFAGAVPRMLVLRSRYWLDDAAIHAAQSMGWEIEAVPVVAEGVLPRENIERLLTTLAHFRPDFILSVNLGGMDVDGIFAGLFEDLAIPFVTWFVDDPRTIIMGRTTYSTPLSLALTWDAAYEDYLRKAGFPHVETLPLAVDQSLFDAEPLDSWDLPPIFVGSSMVNYAQRMSSELQQRYPEVAAATREALDAGSVTRENFVKGIDAMLAPAYVATLDAEQQRLAEMVFFIEGTRRLRQVFIETLAAEGLEVRGDADWGLTIPNAGKPVDYAKELPGLYRRSTLNFNITSIQMPNTVNQRVFDCPAAGGFILTDRQPALAELFDIENEIASYSSLDECLDLFRFYRSNAGARRAIIGRARARILGEHTYQHRLQRIEASLKNHFGC